MACWGGSPSSLPLPRAPALRGGVGCYYLALPGPRGSGSRGRGCAPPSSPYRVSGGQISPALPERVQHRPELPAGPLLALPHPRPARPTWPNFLSIKGEVWERPGRGRWTHVPGHGAWPGPPPTSSCTRGLGCRGRLGWGWAHGGGGVSPKSPPRACPRRPPDHHPDRAPLLPTRLNVMHFVPTSRLNNLKPTAKRVRGARGWASGNIRNDHRVRGSHCYSALWRCIRVTLRGGRSNVF